MVFLVATVPSLKTQNEGGSALGIEMRQVMGGRGLGLPESVLESLVDRLQVRSPLGTSTHSSDSYHQPTTTQCKNTRSADKLYTTLRGLTLLTPVVASDGSSGVSTLSTLSLLLVHGPSSTPPTEGVGLGVGLSERGRTLLE